MSTEHYFLYTTEKIITVFSLAAKGAKVVKADSNDRDSDFAVVKGSYGMRLERQTLARCPEQNVRFPASSVRKDCAQSVLMNPTKYIARKDIQAVTRVTTPREIVKVMDPA
ncbi:hypothetical protein C8J56DRAFT_889434 [Mycena floridula]|nr:hypothetical protein C8J56DRAFT_889434 [Mycena floridula]